MYVWEQQYHLKYDHCKLELFAVPVEGLHYKFIIISLLNITG